MNLLSALGVEARLLGVRRFITTSVFDWTICVRVWELVLDQLRFVAGRTALELPVSGSPSAPGVQGSGVDGQAMKKLAYAIDATRLRRREE
jgi:hypothetical protein